MKTPFISMIAAGAILFSSCGNAPQADKAVTQEAQEVGAVTGTTYQLAAESSTVEWVGTKPTGQHHGTIKIKDGDLAVADNQITGGRFVMDMQSIQPLDQDAEYNEKLRVHLLSEDFFLTEQHPEAVFEITSVQAGADTNNPDVVTKDATHTVNGNLTMKDVTKGISFPAKIEITDNQVIADANFNIDRTDWGITYKSDKSLGDKIIHPTMNLKIHLEAGQ